MLFLEQNQQQLPSGWLGNSIRPKRFQAAYSGDYEFPLVIVDSGHQVTEGEQSDFKAAYRAMVNNELSRPPQAEVSATYWRVDNHLQFQVTITNRSGITLSQSANDATVFVIVYEDVIPSQAYSLTSRLDRAVVYQSIATPLVSNATATFSLATDNLTGVNWDKLHPVAFVDYRPGGATGAYDMLQAALATGPALDVQPSSLSITVTPDHLVDPEATLNVTGSPPGMPWTVQSKPTWATVTPNTGNVGACPVVHVSLSGLKPGINQGIIKISSQYSPIQTREIPIQVDYTPLPLTVSPSQLHFDIDVTNPEDKSSPLLVLGYPYTLTWSVANKPDWATITPSSGTVRTTATVTIDHQKLILGDNNGTIKVHAWSGGIELVQNISISVNYYTPWKVYLVFIRH